MGFRVLFYLFAFLNMQCFLMAQESSTESQPFAPSRKDENQPESNQVNNETQPFEHAKKTATERVVHKFTSTLTLVSDYRSRGISQTMRHPAVQGEFKYEHISGAYFKTWASNVDGTGNFINNCCMEWDFYLGYKRKLFCLPIKIDAGFEYYYYPGGRAHISKYVSYNTVEYYIQLSYKKFNITFHQTLTDFYGVCSKSPPINWNTHRTVKPNGHSYWSPYIEANWQIPFYEKFSLTLHAGYQGVINYPQLNYVDWLVSLTYKFKWFDLFATYVDTTAKHAFFDVPDHAYHPKRKQLGGPGVFVGIARAF